MKTPNRDITDVSEKAFQRAIFNSNTSRIGTKTSIRWLDYELPVINNGKTRRDSLDLLGVYLNGRKKGKYIICEVKYAHGDSYYSNNPAAAAEELVRYENLIGNGTHLEDDDIHHFHGDFDWREVAKRHEKWILANSSYWAHWLGHQNKWSFEKGIYYCYMDIPSNYFDKMYEGVSVYTPQLPDVASVIRTIWPNGDSN